MFIIDILFHFDTYFPYVTLTHLNSNSSDLNFRSFVSLRDEKELTRLDLDLNVYDFQGLTQIKSSSHKDRDLSEYFWLNENRLTFRQPGYLRELDVDMRANEFDLSGVFGDGFDLVGFKGDPANKLPYEVMVFRIIGIFFVKSY